MSHHRRVVTVTAALLLAAGATLSTGPLAAAADQTPPTAPPNVRITQATFDTLTVAWDRATDNSGHVDFYPVFINGVWRSGSYETSVTVFGLAPGTTYQVQVFALDVVGNWSAPATRTAATAGDNQRPPAPTSLRTASGGTVLMWNAPRDNRGIGNYRIFANGTWIFSSGLGLPFSILTETYPLLRHGQTVTLTVQAVDLSGLTSAHSNPLTIRVP